MDEESSVAINIADKYDGYRCTDCGQRMRVRAPEHNGATGYFYCPNCDHLEAENGRDSDKNS